MNLATGELIERRVDVKELSQEKINQLINEGFSGYIVLTVDEGNGIEEGVILLRGGKIVASVYEDLDQEENNCFAEIALQKSVNAFNAEKGVYDLVELSPADIELILAFHAKIKLRQELGKKDLSSFLSKKDAGEQPKEEEKEPKSKISIFKRFGLEKLGKGR